MTHTTLHQTVLVVTELHPVISNCLFQNIECLNSYGAIRFTQSSGSMRMKSVIFMDCVATGTFTDHWDFSCSAFTFNGHSSHISRICCHRGIGPGQGSSFATRCASENTFQLSMIENPPDYQPQAHTSFFMMDNAMSASHINTSGGHFGGYGANGCLHSDKHSGAAAIAFSTFSNSLSDSYYSVCTCPVAGATITRTNFIDIETTQSIIYTQRTTSMIASDLVFVNCRSQFAIGTLSGEPTTGVSATRCYTDTKFVSDPYVAVADTVQTNELDHILAHCDFSAAVLVKRKLIAICITLLLGQNL